MPKRNWGIVIQNVMRKFTVKIWDMYKYLIENSPIHYKNKKVPIFREYRDFFDESL